MLDRLISFRRDLEETLAPLTDVIEDKDAYHDMPGMKGASIEVQVAWQINGERLHRITQRTLTR